MSAWLFQIATTAHLLPYLRAQANIERLLTLSGMAPHRARIQDVELLIAPGMAEHARRWPVQFTADSNNPWT